MWDNHDQKAKRNFLAHIGGHLADWTYTEMLERAGHRCKYRVVYNSQYQYLLGKIKQEITHIMRDKPDQLRIFNEVTDFFSSDVAIGDIFESYVAMKFFNNEAEAVMMLLEIIFYDEFQLNKSGQVTQDGTLAANRELALVSAAGQNFLRILPTQWT